MTTQFNKGFFTPNMGYTRADAESRLISLGYVNFTFKSSCYTNGASFYFESEDGREIRVSDHPLIGKRAFTTVDVPIVDIKPIVSPAQFRNEYLEGRISKKDYKAICKAKGFIFKP